jgi:hypothetical protein
MEQIHDRSQRARCCSKLGPPDRRRDELISDVSDPPYIVIEPDTNVADILAALGWNHPRNDADIERANASDVDQRSSGRL